MLVGWANARHVVDGNKKGDTAKSSHHASPRGAAERLGGRKGNSLLCCRSDARNEAKSDRALPGPIQAPVFGGGG